MIVVTGAAGFIGYNMIQKLNRHNFNDIVAVDRFTEHKHSLKDCRILQKVHRDVFPQWLDEHHEHTEFVIHLGARTDTAEMDENLFRQLNTDYSKKVWEKCVSYQLPLIYASSAAVYGLGEAGFVDEDPATNRLNPLNPYGHSKLAFDSWVQAQERQPFFWCGLRFFNVYGSGEAHKGRMASVVWHAYNQIKETKQMKLFRSHQPSVKDGEQKRDFVYVEDVTDVIYWLMHHRKNSGIYNLGTGKARSFLDLATSVFQAIEVDPDISYIDTPMDIRASYQYFTEAKINKLLAIGYDANFRSLEEGVTDYIHKLVK